MLSKAKKIAKQSADFKADLEAFEETLLATATERKEEEVTAEVCISHNESPSLYQSSLSSSSLNVHKCNVFDPLRDLEKVGLI